MSAHWTAALTQNATTLGYHGTTLERGHSIVANGFTPSDNPHDWIGYGAYLWDHGAGRALEWADYKYPSESRCVVEATVLLSNLLNLADTDGADELERAYWTYAAITDRETIAGHVQSERSHEMDCIVINYLCESLEESGSKIDVVRCAFGEGKPSWIDPLGELPGARIMRRNHVQLAVRDCRAIISTRVVKTWA